MHRSHQIFLIILLLVIVIAGVFTGLYLYTKQQNHSSDLTVALQGSSDRPTVFTDVNGAIVTALQSEEKTRVIYSWASWSPFSKDDLLLLNEIAAEYPDVEFIALNRAETPLMTQRFLATVPDLTHITLLIDTNDSVYQAVGGYAVPETLVYSTSGTLKSQLRGSLNKAQLLDVLSE
jgi:thiol-disulfide isomerase/thioredoxin